MMGTVVMFVILCVFPAVMILTMIIAKRKGGR